jgi:hypothetical protein
VKITEDDIRKFQDIWRKVFAEEISADEARAHIERLDALYLLLYRPNRRAEATALGDRENANHE